MLEYMYLGESSIRYESMDRILELARCLEIRDILENSLSKSQVNTSQDKLPDTIQVLQWQCSKCDYQASGEKFLESHFMVIHGEENFQLQI